MRHYLSLLVIPLLSMPFSGVLARAADQPKPADLQAPAGRALLDKSVAGQNQTGQPQTGPASSRQTIEAPSAVAQACVAQASVAPKEGGNVPPRRQTLEQRFVAANVAHDGRLTLAEAKAGYPEVAKHFDDIDADHKGYVSQGDIRAWRVMRRAARRLMKQPEDKLRPRPAFDRTYPDFRTAPVAGKQIIAASTGPLRSER